MPEYKDTIDDFNLKWSHSYVLIDGEPSFIQSAEYTDEEDEQGYVVYGQTRTGKFTTPQFNLECVKPIVVDTCFFNIDNSDPNNGESEALHIIRTGIRQNKRSLCQDSFRLMDPLTGLLNILGVMWYDKKEFDWKVVDGLLKPHYPISLEEAMGRCKTNWAVALSPNFSITLSPQKEYCFLLKSLFGFIGGIRENKIIVHHKASLQEVTDLVRRNNYATSVELAS